MGLGQFSQAQVGPFSQAPKPCWKGWWSLRRPPVGTEKFFPSRQPSSKKTIGWLTISPITSLTIQTASEQNWATGKSFRGKLRCRALGNKKKRLRSESHSHSMVPGGL